MAFAKILFKSHSIWKGKGIIIIITRSWWNANNYTIMWRIILNSTGYSWRWSSSCWRKDDGRNSGKETSKECNFGFENRANGGSDPLRNWPKDEEMWGMLLKNLWVNKSVKFRSFCYLSCYGLAAHFMANFDMNITFIIMIINVFVFSPSFPSLCLFPLLYAVPFWLHSFILLNPVDSCCRHCLYSKNFCKKWQSFSVDTINTSAIILQAFFCKYPASARSFVLSLLRHWL